MLQTLARQCQALSEQIAGLERELRRRAVEDEATRRLLEIPGIGPITATALRATIVEPTSFRSAREFVAWIGLVPRPSSSGGHARLGWITKMGHAYLRRLLISGAQAVRLQAARRPETAGPWLERLLREKPRKVVATALANQTARIVWAMG